EERVLGIAVLDGVATELERVGEVPADGIERRLAVRGDRVEAPAPLVDVEARGRARRNAERRFVPSHCARVTPDRGGEALFGVHRRRTYLVHCVSMAAHARSSSPANPALHDTVSRLLHTHAQRLTPTRAHIVDVLADASGPMTIPEILAARDGLAQS